jgi:tetratricopeptide (TPR) repeat protein
MNLMEMPEGKELKNDPGYSLYKEGYGLILDEEWETARKKFSELLSKYPKSEYAEDATYWSAYALKDIDKKKALKAYKEFIAKYPKSTYFDDAIADMADLGLPHRVHGSGNSYTVEVSADDSTMPNMTIYKNSQNGGKSYSYGFGYGFAPHVSSAPMRKLRRELSHLGNIRTPNVFPMPFTGFWTSDEDDKIDEKTRLKMEALEALGETKEDSTSFNTLSDVARDKSQPVELRETAMDALSNFHHFDVLSVFIDVAKNDTSEEIQETAIDYIGSLTKNKDRSVETLIELYNALPKDRSDQRETIFHSIAEIGNDKAVDFLTEVAKSDPDYQMRSQAVYYLGNIGGEKARTALYEILKEK